MDIDELIAEFEAERNGGPCCKIGALGIAGLVDALHARGAGARTIGAFLRRKGWAVSDGTVNKHLKEHVQRQD